MERDGCKESYRESRDTMTQWQIGGGRIIKAYEKKKQEIKREREGEEKKKKDPPHSSTTTTSPHPWRDGVREYMNERIRMRQRDGGQRDYLSPLLTQWDDNTF